MAIAVSRNRNGNKNSVTESQISCKQVGQWNLEKPETEKIDGRRCLGIACSVEAFAITIPMP